ncbi:MAG: GNAT family N-acetyltransferase [Nitriliruptoraceae bacterium]
MSTPDAITLVDLTPTHPLLDEAYTVLIELRTQLDRDAYVALFTSEQHANWTSTAAIIDDFVVGVVNWRLQRNTAHGFGAFIDDLCTTQTRRSQGVGAAMSRHVIGRARDLGCNDVTLTSGNQRLDAHRFYLREGWVDSSKFFRYAL